MNQTKKRKKDPVRSWAKLDNAAKIFPPASSSRDTNVFRFSCELIDYIDPEILQGAVDAALQKFPFYRSVLHRGFFWYYFEESDLSPRVHVEDKSPCSPLFDPDVKELLFDVSYYRNRINLEIFHSLADGTGSLYFLQEIVYQYIIERYHVPSESQEPLRNDVSDENKKEDSFRKYYDKDEKKKRTVHLGKAKAYQQKARFWPESRIEIMEAHAEVSEVLACAKNYGVSLTIYLTAVLVRSFYELMKDADYKKPVIIAVPVNLRNYFPSDTSRNFFALIYVSYQFSHETPDFYDILQSVKEQFHDQLQPEKLLTRINELMALEQNLLVRMVPLIIKNPVLRLANRLAQKESTITLSNLGRIDMPDFCKPFIEKFDVFTGTDSTQICVCSYENQLMISSASVYAGFELEKHFFRFLAKDNLHICMALSIREERERHPNSKVKRGDRR